MPWLVGGSYAEGDLDLEPNHRIGFHKVFPTLLFCRWASCVVLEVDFAVVVNC